MITSIKLKIFILLANTLIISGCATTLPKIDAKESNKYINDYMQEYSSSLKKHSMNKNKIIKWVQAANKKESCEIFSGASIDSNKRFRVFWDGQCKDGYAYGLGREFIKNLDTKTGEASMVEALAHYKKTAHKPDYYMQKYFFMDYVKTQEGDINNGYFVESDLKNNEHEFDMNFKSGYFGSETKPSLLVQESPFSDDVTHYKFYTNFYYSITNYMENEFSSINFWGNTFNSENKEHGYGFGKYKNNGQIQYQEVENGNLLREVKAPHSHYLNFRKIMSETVEAKKKALESQKNALRFKEIYKKTICKNLVRVRFMDNSEYKKICNSVKQQETYQHRYDEKMAQIEQQKDNLRDQRRQQRIARERQAVVDAQAKRDASNFLKGLGAFLGGAGKAARDYQPSTNNTYTAPSVNFGNTQSQRSGTPIYDASRCIGSVINGQCMGTIKPSGEVEKRCYGTVMNGRCIGGTGY